MDGVDRFHCHEGKSNRSSESVIAEGGITKGVDRERVIAGAVNHAIKQSASVLPPKFAALCGGRRGLAGH
jgi:hypothetical protein